VILILLVAKMNDSQSAELPSTGMISKSPNGRALRELPEAMLDPYSVLGVLSFGVYIFYILYTRYRMRNHHSPTGNNGAQLFTLDAQENFANILKMATKIISSASYLENSNSTVDSEADYLDTEAADSSDLRANRKFHLN